ncbi:uracil-DNA glycosylase [Szabonella alba]|uniref:Uracil-DNA glycosylase n=1 Tax=Szabonella alba TaxID=2804194 RepID=A0A8K0Y2F7_9RHOB|nr:uracil-DNA glycosylase [Szabonella alba]MBL4917464.1 uracil-DNA glycosylase [Szabonella alba]
MWPDIPASWADLPFFQNDWNRLQAELDAESGWQPPRDQVFRALHLTPRDRVRVVILGQDPYHTAGRATGLAFSFPPGTPPRDSLKNILTELETDLGIPRVSGDLSGWAEQGVLLLNTVLTVPVGRAHGHKRRGWERLVSQVLAAVAGDGPRAFLLWGGPAQKLCRTLPRDGHLFLETAHPSPLSVYRGFYGSRPFSAVNDWLAGQGERPIDWAR